MGGIYHLGYTPWEAYTPLLGPQGGYIPLLGPQGGYIPQDIHQGGIYISGYTPGRHIYQGVP